MEVHEGGEWQELARGKGTGCSGRVKVTGKTQLALE